MIIIGRTGGDKPRPYEPRAYEKVSVSRFKLYHIFDFCHDPIPRSGTLVIGPCILTLKSVKPKIAASLFTSAFQLIRQDSSVPKLLHDPALLTQ